MKTKLLLSTLIVFSIQNFAQAEDGRINFVGSIVDSVCSVSTDNNNVGCIKDVNNKDAQGNTIVTKKFEKAVDFSDFPKTVGVKKEFEYDGQKASIEKINESKPYYEMTININ